MPEKIVQPTKAVIERELKKLVRGNVEKALNKLLEAESKKLTQAAQYEHNDQRQGDRRGRYIRNLAATSGDIPL